MYFQPFDHAWPLFLWHEYRHNSVLFPAGLKVHTRPGALNGHIHLSKTNCKMVISLVELVSSEKPEANCGDSCSDSFV